MKEPREDGSLLLALLAAIILAGVLVALFTTVFTGTQSARFDRNFTQAFQIADAGVQQAFVQLLELEPADIEDGTAPCEGDDRPGVATPHPDGTGPNAIRGTCTMTLEDGATFTWVYEQTADDRRQWTVTSQGSFNGVNRAVQVTIGEGPLFSAALLSEDQTFWSGGGQSTQDCPDEGTFPVSVEGPALIDPSGDCVSQLTLYGVDRVITGEDKINTYLSGTDPETDEPKEVVFPKVPLDLPDIGGMAFEEGGVCHSRDAKTETPKVFERGVVYCLTDFIAGNDSYTVVPDLPDTVSPANREPAIVYVQNSVKFNSGTEVNVDQMAVDLQIYSGGDEVRIQSTANARAAVWAPKAYCHSTGGAGAQGEFWGALACFNIHLSGNWNYDPSVSVITSPTFRISNYTEEVPTSS